MDSEKRMMKGDWEVGMIVVIKSHWNARPVDTGEIVKVNDKSGSFRVACDNGSEVLVNWWGTISRVLKNDKDGNDISKYLQVYAVFGDTDDIEELRAEVARRNAAKSAEILTDRARRAAEKAESERQYQQAKAAWLEWFMPLFEAAPVVMADNPPTRLLNVTIDRHGGVYGPVPAALLVTVGEVDYPGSLRFAYKAAAVSLFTSGTDGDNGYKPATWRETGNGPTAGDALYDALGDAVLPADQ